MTQTPSEVRALLERHGLRPRKRLGQHFLADPNIVDRVLALAGPRPDDAVLEVGAGTGALTAALAAQGCRVVAYEIDRALEPILREVLAGSGVELRFEDATVVDYSTWTSTWRLVANLPYNVGTPLLLDLLRHAPAFVSFCVMIQKEVADRLTAAPGSKVYGLPSVVVGLHTRLVDGFRVPPQVFVPPPAVESKVIRLDRVEAPAAAERAIELAAAAFGQRRKMLRQSLREVLPDVTTALAGVGLDPAQRPENVAPAEWLALADGAS